MDDSSSTASARRGRLLVLAAAVLWSTSGLILKSQPLVDLPQSQRGPMLACYRALFAACVLFPFVRRQDICWKPAMGPMVFAFTAMNVMFVTAMTRTTAAAAIFLQYTSVVWAFVFGWLFLRERIDRGNLMALVVAACGIVWIVAADWRGENFVGNALALGAGVSYAGVILSLRCLKNESAAWLVALNHLVAGCILLPWVLSDAVPLNTSQWSLVALLGVMQMAVPYVLFARGVRRLRIQEAALLGLIEPILNPMWVWLCWGEEVNLSVWIGGALILGGLAVRYLLFPSDQRPAS